MSGRKVDGFQLANLDNTQLVNMGDLTRVNVSLNEPRSKPNWSLLFKSSSEITLAQHIAAVEMSAQRIWYSSPAAWLKHWRPAK